MAVPSFLVAAAVWPRTVTSACSVCAGSCSTSRAVRRCRRFPAPLAGRICGACRRSADGRADPAASCAGTTRGPTVPLREGVTGCQPGGLAAPGGAGAGPCCARSRLRFAMSRLPMAGGHVSRPRRAGYPLLGNMRDISRNRQHDMSLNYQPGRLGGHLRDRRRCVAGSFVAGCVRRHPDYEDLVARRPRARAPQGRPGPRARLGGGGITGWRVPRQCQARRPPAGAGPRRRAGPVSPPPGASRPAAGASPAR